MYGMAPLILVYSYNSMIRLTTVTDPVPTTQLLPTMKVMRSLSTIIMPVSAIVIDILGGRPLVGGSNHY